MARSKKTYALNVEKNQVPQGGWLAWYSVTGGATGDLDPVPVYAAFTTASAGKRFLAHAVGRSRITWTDLDGEGMRLTAEVEVSE